MLLGNVKKSAYLGHCMEYVVDTLAGELLVIDHNTDRTHDIGDGVALQALQLHAHWVA
jgi:xanthine dehydrogenase molybdopterin-binding subunit B